MWIFVKFLILVAIVNNCTAAPQVNSTEESETCKCVPHQQCKNGEELVEVQTLEKTVECEEPGNVYCCRYSNISRVKRQIVSQPTCGVRNPSGLGMLGINRYEANFGEFPWMIALMFPQLQQDSNGVVQSYNFYAGGGSLIHPQVVLTAAHVAIKHQVGKSRIRAGEWDPRSKIEPLPYQERMVTKIILHEKYDPRSPMIHHDYALMILDRPLTLDRHISPICLPSRLIDYDPVSCFVSGWGSIPGAVGPDPVKVLKKIWAPIVDRNICQTMISAYKGISYTLDKSIICAGGINGEDACVSDSGSPLVCPIRNSQGLNTNQYIQVGVVSWGVSCVQPVPAGYASVLIANGWIKRKMADNGISLNGYQYKNPLFFP